MKYIILFFGLAAICNGSNLSGRISNGLPSAEDDSYAVAVYSARSGIPFPEISKLSTGVAISKYIVVVAGQAIYGFNNFRVGINSRNRNIQNIAEVSFYELHQLYNPETLEYNVGVLRVSTTIMHYINLALAAPTFPVLFGIGFGHNNGDLPDSSQQTALHLYDTGDCRRQYNQRVIRPSNFCAQSVGQFGPGDQGAPVVDFARQQVYGIVSFWNPDNTTGNPVVLTDFVQNDIQEFLVYFVHPNNITD
jgi:hypothetical protein